MFYETGALDIASVHGNAKFGNGGGGGGGGLSGNMFPFLSCLWHTYATVTGEGIKRGVDMVSHFTLPFLIIEKNMS